MKTLAGIGCGLLVWLLAACASVPKASPDQDAKAKDFVAPPNMALLYIYRSEGIGPAVAMGVSVNGIRLGETVVHSYFRLDVKPGTYIIESFAEDVSTLDMAAEAGKTYFIWQEVKGGKRMAKSKLQLVDDSVGRVEVVKLKLIATSVVGETITPLAAGSTVQPTARPNCAASDQSPHTGESFLTAPPDKALIYVFRPGRFFSAIRTFRISFNGVSTTDMNNGTYCTCMVEPGRLQLVARVLPGPLMGPLMYAIMKPSELALDAKKGETYFIDVQIAGSGGPNLVLASENAAKTGIKGTKPSTLLETEQK